RRHALSLFLPPVSFCSHSAADHRHLPSFPTRRSSDLAGPARGRQRAGRPGHQVDGRGFARPAPPRVLGGLELRARHVARHRDAEDRKSTRLNSSHVKISYAVFCLKKKKRPPNQTTQIT